MSKMYVRDLHSSGSDIEVLGVRHSSVRDTRYVSSKIKNQNYDVALVEKHPEIELSSYKEQTRRIIGHIRESDIRLVEFDRSYEEGVLHERIDDSLQDVKVKGRYRSEIMSDVREKVREQSEDLYEQMLENREREMIRLTRREVVEKDIDEAVIVVGETHVNPIYDALTSE